MNGDTWLGPLGNQSLNIAVEPVRRADVLDEERMTGTARPHITWLYDDGGRQAAGRRGDTGDCAVRAVAIAAQLDYSWTYSKLYELQRDVIARRRKPRKRKSANDASPRTGTDRKALVALLVDELGWQWTPTMFVGSGCRVHLRADELPAGRLVVSLSRHVCAVVDGVVFDTYDPSRDGTRCVYGYWCAP